MPAQPATVVLNELQVDIDDKTGALTRLAHPATGVILDASADRSGILTVSLPLQEFVGLQLEPRLSLARVTKGKDAVTLSWDSLQANRQGLATKVSGVKAEVTLRAAPDKRSIILSARVENGSPAEVTQVLFPDLRGLRPFDVPERMELRMALGVVNPFAEAPRHPERATFYPHHMWHEYPAGGQYQRNALRWMDYGSLKGGISLFERKWMVEPRPNILTNRNEADPHDLRVAWQHKIRLRPGQSWQSGEYWLTPHRGGWAKGIETYRAYVQQEHRREAAVPERIRNGIGFQTIWMSQSAESDPSRAAFRFTDLVRVARDAKAHGIDELVLWGWCVYGSLPVQPRRELGTAEELIAAVRAARELGVNVTPFFNLKNLDDRFAARFNMKAGNAAPWVYHPEMIPAIYPFTMPSSQIDVPTDNPVWRKDASEALLEWARRGVTSFAFDVYDDVGKMALIDTTRDIRAEVRKYDPEASFAGEPVGGSSFERSARVLDYTWNWMDYVDAGPLLNTLKYPRFNLNAERSARVVKMGFVDGLYLNVMPRKPNEPNGTKLISEEPELAMALKEVVPLRKQFLRYFTEANYLGDSVLTEPVAPFVRKEAGSWVGGATVEVGELEYPPVMVRGWQLPDRLLIAVLNNSDAHRTAHLSSDLSLWLPAAKRYRVTRYDGSGKAQPAGRPHEGVHWQGTVHDLRPLELSFIEVSVDR